MAAFARGLAVHNGAITNALLPVSEGRKPKKYCSNTHKRERTDSREEVVASVAAPAYQQPKRVSLNSVNHSLTCHGASLLQWRLALEMCQVKAHVGDHTREEKVARLPVAIAITRCTESRCRNAMLSPVKTRRSLQVVQPSHVLLRRLSHCAQVYKLAQIEPSKCSCNAGRS